MDRNGSVERPQRHFLEHSTEMEGPVLTRAFLLDVISFLRLTRKKFNGFITAEDPGETAYRWELFCETTNDDRLSSLTSITIARNLNVVYLLRRSDNDVFLLQ